MTGDESGGLDNVIMTSSGTSAWDLWDFAGQDGFRGVIRHFRRGARGGDVGEDLSYADASSGGLALSYRGITVNNLTVEADALVTGTLILATGVTTFSPRRRPRP